jgi:ABC-type multidrug transport system fused ATPase/permease subunit
VRLFEIVDTKPEVEPPVKPQPLQNDVTISVQNLSFHYKSQVTSPALSLSKGRKPHGAVDSPSFILHPSSFSLPVGKRMAIVGPSGAGKTTLLNLLLRFWDFQDGEITFGGQDIRGFDPEELRQQYAVVSQHTHLFNASLRENLLIAKPDATETEIVRAAQNARIHAFIETLPESYDTFIGEQGMNLSAGERQRIAIARAILKDAPILILDEPTANLDTLTEMAVLESVHKLMQGRSTLLATHRLIGMEWMDEILVLRTGKIIERGNHPALLAFGGIYRRMWDSQMQQLL